MQTDTGIRIRVELSDFFECRRKQCRLYIDREAERTVKDVEDHICRLFDITVPVEVLDEDGWLFPSSESSHAFQEGEAIRVVAAEVSEAGRNSKLKRKRCEDVNGHTPKRTKKPNNNEAEVDVSLVESGAESGFDKNGTPSNLSDEMSFKKPVLKDQPKQHKNGHSEIEPSFELQDKVDREGCQTPDNSKNSMVINDTDNNCTLQTDNDPKSNSDQKSSEDESKSVSSKRKRIRRRKKKNKNQEEDKGNKQGKPELPKSSYLLSKRLQGVNHILSFAREDRKHIFFDKEEPSSTTKPVETEGADGEQSSTNTPSSSRPPSPAGSVSATSAGDLSKLLALSAQKAPPVFERKKPETLQITIKKDERRSVTSNACDKPSPLLTEIPVRGSLIKFKVLRMINYSPMMSDEISARVISTDLSIGNLQLEILDGGEQLKEERGKFSLQGDDDHEEEERTVSVVSMNWNELLEPHLA